MQGSQRIKILFVVTKSVWGGAQRYVFDLATNLPKQRFETAIAVGGNGPLAQKLSAHDVPVYPISHFQKSINPFKDIQVFFELLSLYRAFRPYIIHANSSKAGGIASAAALLYQLLSGNRVRCIFTAHGWAFLEPRPRWQLYAIRIASKLTALLHTRVIVISQRDKHAVRRYNIAPERKVSLIYNGIDDMSFLPRTQAQQELFGTEYPFVIGTVAEWTKNKGLAYLLEAMPFVLEKFPKAKLCLVGWGEERMKLEACIMKLKLEKSVFLVSKSPVASYLRAFDIFVLPSLKEGLPYTIFEAGLSELPVIASRVGGIPDIIEQENHGLLVNPASPEQLADAIIKLTRDKRIRERMGQELRKRVKQYFSLSKMLQKTIEIYME